MLHSVAGLGKEWLASQWIAARPKKSSWGGLQVGSHTVSVLIKVDRHSNPGQGGGDLLVLTQDERKYRF